MKLKPSTPGLRVWDPDRRAWLPEEGRTFRKPLSQYWLRRLKAGDVVEVKEKDDK